jgi:hypothetical protein
VKMEFAVFVKSQVTTAGVRQSAMSHMYAGADLVPRPADCNRKKKERGTLLPSLCWFGRYATATGSGSFLRILLVYKQVSVTHKSYTASARTQQRIIIQFPGSFSNFCAVQKLFWLSVMRIQFRT